MSIDVFSADVHCVAAPADIQFPTRIRRRASSLNGSSGHRRARIARSILPTARSARRSGSGAAVLAIVLALARGVRRGTQGG
jgi:hypothetical protein